MRREPVDVAGLLATGGLVPQAPDLVSLTDPMDAADRDVIASHANLALFSPRAEAMLYEAGLRLPRGPRRFAEARGRSQASEGEKASPVGTPFDGYGSGPRMTARTGANDVSCNVAKT